MLVAADRQRRLDRRRPSRPVTAKVVGVSATDSRRHPVARLATPATTSSSPRPAWTSPRRRPAARRHRHVGLGRDRRRRRGSRAGQRPVRARTASSSAGWPATPTPPAPSATTGNGRVNLARALADVATDRCRSPRGAAGDGGPFVGPYVARRTTTRTSRPDGHRRTPTTTFSTLYRKTTGGTVQHVRITLPVGYTNISVAATAFSSGTWSTPVVNQVTRTVDVQLTAGTGLATNNVELGADRRDSDDAAGEPERQRGRVADADLHEHRGHSGRAERQPARPHRRHHEPVGDDHVPSMRAVTPIPTPVLQNGVAADRSRPHHPVRERHQVHRCRRSHLLQQPDRCDDDRQYRRQRRYDVRSSPTASSGCRAARSPNNGSLTVQFTTTPNCVSGTYLVSSTPSTNATNPPSGTNQSVSTTGGSLTVAAGLADLSITKTDSPDPGRTGRHAHLHDRRHERRS